MFRSIYSHRRVHVVERRYGRAHIAPSVAWSAATTDATRTEDWTHSSVFTWRLVSLKSLSLPPFPRVSALATLLARSTHASSDVVFGEISLVRLTWAQTLFLGLITSICITSGLRLNAVAKVFTDYDHNDLMWGNRSLGVWSAIETNVAIVCCCLPPLRPLLGRISPSIVSVQEVMRSWRSGSSSAVSGSKGKFAKGKSVNANENNLFFLFFRTERYTIRDKRR